MHLADAVENKENVRTRLKVNNLSCEDLPTTMAHGPPSPVSLTARGHNYLATVMLRGLMSVTMLTRPWLDVHRLPFLLFLEHEAKSESGY